MENQIFSETAGQYVATTRAIAVTVEPEFLPNESDPDDARYIWAYHVIIANNGMETVRLRRRHWLVTDANGVRHEVDGQGVVGEQPLLEPGDVFEYTSGTPLRTSSGIMSGNYSMETTSGEVFDVEIPAFSLDSPYRRELIN
ncbi:MAG: Co2+/Mg2+ efflux protein ApaG [Rhodospirillaceae bacterium]|nr:Co2+/Mg2+ efflux protein ApaG [Rhodospirillaceae bacterium]